MRPVVPIHHQLMRTGHHLETVRLVEVLRDVLAEGVASSARGNAPAHAVVWIRPEEVADWTFMWHFLFSVELFDLIKGFDTWR